MQTVQTQIRLLLKEQSDQGLHCLPFRIRNIILARIVEKKVFEILGHLNKLKSSLILYMPSEIVAENILIFSYFLFLFSSFFFFFLNLNFSVKIRPDISCELAA